MKAKLGSGKRFAAVEKSAAASGADDPAAVAAVAGRKKLGKARFQKLAAKGRHQKAMAEHLRGRGMNQY